MPPNICYTTVFKKIVTKIFGGMFSILDPATEV